MNKWTQAIALLFFTAMNINCSACDTEAYVVSNPPLLVVGTDIIDFGALPLDFTSTRTLQLANAGQQELKFDEITIESEDSVFMLAPFEDSIRGGQSYDLSISFTPAEEKFYEATLKLVSNSQDKAEVLVTLLGQGLDEVICGDCDQPPEEACLDENTLMVYQQEGECVEGVCRYIPENINCPYGCEDAACLPGGDGGIAEAGDAGALGEPTVELMMMALGEASTCGTVRDTDGEVACWGAADTLGDGSLAGEDRNVPGIIPNFDNVREIAAGADHMCATKSDDTLWCWGKNAHGQVGDNTTTTQRQPVKVEALEDPVKNVAAGRMFTCAVTQATGEDNKVYCWGKGDKGQLGNGATDGSMTPQLVLGLADAGEIYSIYAGEAHVCIEIDDTKLYCWGWNHMGQCLVPGGADQLSAVQVGESFNMGAITQVALGAHHTCLLLSDEKVVCWGGDDCGQQDDGNAGAVVTESPTTPQGLVGETFHSVVSGGQHSCAINTDFKVFCWGNNTQGACGSGNDFIQNVQPVQPIDALGNHTWHRIYAGKDHTCGAVLIDGHYYSFCWGLNSSGQLGDGTNISQRNSPSPVTW